MGKYMISNSKTSKQVSLLELSSFSGVLTRAKTLALRKATTTTGSYIQLRSRRLVKPNSPNKLKESTTCITKNPVNNINSPTVNKSTIKVDYDKKEELDDEGSFGENTLENQEKGRTTRETTPCSLIKDPDTIKTPSSSTKSTRPTETKCIVLSTTSKPIPSTSEVDAFFMGLEKQQQRLFIEKYNFDPVSDKPLHGRFEWVKLDATKKS